MRYLTRLFGLLAIGMAIGFLLDKTYHSNQNHSTPKYVTVKYGDETYKTPIPKDRTTFHILQYGTEVSIIFSSED